RQTVLKTLIRFTNTQKATHTVAFLLAAQNGLCASLANQLIRLDWVRMPADTGVATDPQAICDTNHSLLMARLA
ncbi:MAG: hypothetical protein KA214_07500, partial [Neisseriaceae bacterium]|nr:hypothetical protein [Neisseriaceae bacterium]